MIKNNYDNVVVHIISNLSIGGAQLLLLDILKNLKKFPVSIIVITIDSGFYIKKFRDAGIKVIDIKTKGLINPFIYFKLKKELKKISPQIVHTHLLKADFYGRLAAKSANVPAIFTTCHNDSTVHTQKKPEKKNIFDFIDNWVIDFTKSNIVAISNKVRDYLVKRKPDIKQKSLKVIFNGIDIKKEEYILNKEEIKYFKESLGFSTQDKIISVIGRLEKQKGHLEFLKAVSSKIKQKNLKILFVGEGIQRSNIEGFIEKSNLQENVELIGFKENSERYFEISDLIAVPSLWEGFGLVACEGMIKGKIVLASNVGGLPEIIEDGINGYLYDLNNPGELIQKLEFIINNLDNLNHIRQNAIEKVKKCFDINQNAEEYYKLYCEKLKVNVA
ncbi:MAG: glycosyltransferase [Ignavibacteria bacterium]|nr:glycosyltransferase [Ignavibacteria bacterium]